jgi:antitoxin VapB
MPITRAFKSGNSQAIRIPAELAYADMSQEFTITRVGDVITIAPAQSRWKESLELLRTLPKPTEVEVLERIEMPDREFD